MSYRAFCRSSRVLTLVLAVALLPSTALSVELFEGNLGVEGDWLQVLDSTNIGDRVYWYEVLGDVSYEVQFAADQGFSNVVLQEDQILTNYVTPGLGLGFYYFRVRAIDALGAPSAWSKTGTLEVIEDLESPTAMILSPLDGTTVAKGEQISIELEVADDTLLHLAQFRVGGVYVGTIGLKTENYKLNPSFGEPRTVFFNCQIPAKGNAGALEISVVVTDVLYRSAQQTIVLNAAKGADSKQAGPKNSKARGRRK